MRFSRLPDDLEVPFRSDTVSAQFLPSSSLSPPRGITPTRAHAHADAQGDPRPNRGQSLYCALPFLQSARWYLAPDRR